MSSHLCLLLCWYRTRVAFVCYMWQRRKFMNWSWSLEPHHAKQGEHRNFKFFYFQTHAGFFSSNSKQNWCSSLVHLEEKKCPSMSNCVFFGNAIFLRMVSSSSIIDLHLRSMLTRANVWYGILHIRTSWNGILMQPFSKNQTLLEQAFVWGTRMEALPRQKRFLHLVILLPRKLKHGLFPRLSHGYVN